MKEFRDQAALMMMRGLACGKPEPLPTGKNCTQCGGELVYPERGIIHLDPPRKRFTCTGCGMKGFIPCEEPKNLMNIEKPKREDNGS